LLGKALEVVAGRAGADAPITHAARSRHAIET
jgi:hypothetical protein